MHSMRLPGGSALTLTEFVNPFPLVLTKSPRVRDILADPDASVLSAEPDTAAGRVPQAVEHNAAAAHLRRIGRWSRALPPPPHTTSLIENQKLGITRQRSICPQVARLAINERAWHPQALRRASPLSTAQPGVAHGTVALLPFQCSSRCALPGTSARAAAFRSSHSLTQPPEVPTVSLVGYSAASRPMPATALSATHTEHANTAADSGPIPAEVIQRAQAGLAWEAQQGCPNVQGQRQRFADFAADSFAVLSAHQTLEEAHMQGGCGAIAASFRNYELLSPAQRHQLTQVAQAALRKLQNQDTLTPISSGPHAAADSTAPGRVAMHLPSISKAPAPAATSAAESSPQGNQIPSDMDPSALVTAARQIQQQPVADGKVTMEEGPDVGYGDGRPPRPEFDESEAFRTESIARTAEEAELIEGDLDEAAALAREFMSASEGREEEAGPQPAHGDQLPELPEGFAYSGRRKVKEATLRMREQFLATAMAATVVVAAREGAAADMAAGEQRTAEWHALRDSRLTASAFSNALGCEGHGPMPGAWVAVYPLDDIIVRHVRFWTKGRVQLWEEKLNLVEPFAGNAATQWGNLNEEHALKRYEQVSGQHVEACRFQVKRDDLVHGWLGASPDGLVGNELGQAAGALQGPGILEIKCPFNRGRPQYARPPQEFHWYYVPQVQGLMEIFDREWCHAYIWTPTGSALWTFHRDRDYWRTAYEVLANYWWEYLIPAKHAIAEGDYELDDLRPAAEHLLTADLRKRSKEMAKAAPGVYFGPEST